MKTSYYTKLYNPYSLAVVDLVYSSNGIFMIARINVPTAHRGNGIASELLRQVLEDADKEGVTLHLGVSPSNGLDYDQLVAWYKRYGFEDSLIRGLLHRTPKVKYLPIVDNEIKLASALLRIASIAMPDTHFQADSRCQFAREILRKNGIDPDTDTFQGGGG